MRRPGEAPGFKGDSQPRERLRRGEKNHVVPTSWQDEALARDGVSREVPCSALKGETVPDTFFDWVIYFSGVEL